MPTDPPGPDVIGLAVVHAQTVTDRALGLANTHNADHTALRAACFAEVLRARLAYEYALAAQPGALWPAV